MVFRIKKLGKLFNKPPQPQFSNEVSNSINKAVMVVEKDKDVEKNPVKPQNDSLTNQIPLRYSKGLNKTNATIIIVAEDEPNSEKSCQANITPNEIYVDIDSCVINKRSQTPMKSESEERECDFDEEEEIFD